MTSIAHGTGGARWGWLDRAAPIAALCLLVLSVLVRYGDLREPSLCHGDEVLTALRSQGLVREGHGWTPYWNGTINLHKPPLYYWLVAAGYGLFGVGEFAVRLPSVLCLIGLLVVAYRMNARRFGPWAGVLAAALLAVHPVLVGQSRLGMMDTLVLLLFMAGGLALWRAAEREPFFYLWGALSGLALLAKGGGAILCLPVSLLYLAVCQPRAFRSRHFYGGLLVFLALPAVWFGSQWVLHKEDLVRTYFTWEVKYRLQGHNKWETFAAQTTTRRLWNSLGAWAPLCIGSLALAPFLPGRERRTAWRREPLFFHSLLLVCLLLTNLIKQQMYWYILPGVVPLLMLAAAVTWEAVTGRAPRWVRLAVCVLLGLGSCLPGAILPGTGGVVWAARVALCAAGGGLLVRRWPAAWAGAFTLAAAVALVWTGLSFDNEHVNLVRARDSQPLKTLALAVPRDADPALPLVFDFKYFPMNAALFYADRKGIQWDELDRAAIDETATSGPYYGIFKGGAFSGLTHFAATVLASEGRYQLVRLASRPSD